MTIQTLMSSPQFWISSIVAVFIAMFAYKSSKVSGKKVGGMPKALVVLVSIALVIGALWMSNVGTLVGLGSAFSVGGVDNSDQPVQDTNNLIDGKCLTADTTTITLSAQDNYLSSATGGTHRYRINGNPALTVSDASTFTASPGDVITVLWENASLDGYFSKVATYTVPCTGTKTYSEKLSRNGTLTVNFFNTDGNKINQVADNQTMVAGDIKNVRTEIEGTYQRDYPYGFIAVVEYNKTAMDDVQLTQSGVELTSAGIPQTHAPTLGAESTTKAYLISEIMSNQKLDLVAVLDADDTLNPIAGAGNDVIITLFPRNYFINDKNGGAFEGPVAEDEYNAVTRTGQISSVLYVQ